MALVLLVMPPLPSPLGSPHLGQGYLAASLLQDGHEVRVADLAAPAGPGLDAAGEADLIAVTVFTDAARAAYDLVPRLRPAARLLVAGGPHATVRPEEALAQGFDAAVRGEGEPSLPALARALDAGDDGLDDVPGVVTRAGRGRDAEPVADLDTLPSPLGAAACWDPAWYPPGREAVAGGMLTSRGCPGRCTFCSNQVTGRVLRRRSAPAVVAELTERRERHGATHVPFWDDAFAADRPGLRDLCESVSRAPALEGLTWSCSALAGRLTSADLRRMRRAGCVAVDVGLESGDEAVLRRAGRSARPARVLAALRAARAEGLTTIVNVMFGFPGEGVPELEQTLEWIERLAPHADFFNARGVLVPYPGTEVYERHQAHFGFSDWWLVPWKATGDWANPEVDPALDRDFFRYPDRVRELIDAGLRAKADHNRRTLARLGARR